MLLFMAAAALMSACQKEPEAIIDADKKTVETGEEITFSNSSTDADSYSWEFGDGEQSTETAPKKTYTTSGTYTAKMTAYSKNKKKTANATVGITVNDINKKFAGNYNMNGGCDVGTYVMNISTAGSTSIIITATGTVLNGTVSGSNYTIPAQTFYEDNGDTKLVYSGNGSLDGNLITINLTLDQYYWDYSTCGGFCYAGTSNCNDFGTKQ